MRGAPVVVGRTRARSMLRTRLARTPLRERMVLALLLVDRLRPVEVATALRMSLRQVERIRSYHITSLARAVAGAHADAPVRRAA